MFRHNDKLPIRTVQWAPRRDRVRVFERMVEEDVMAQRTGHRDRRQPQPRLLS